MGELKGVIVEERQRFTLVEARGSLHTPGFAEAIEIGLSASPKVIPSRFFYDEIGSELFERICDLPEYYLTRAEREILQTHAADILADSPTDLTLVELGSGSAVKTKLLMEELLKTHARLRFTPIDISRSAIEACASHLLQTFDDLEILAVASDYHSGLSILKARNSGPELILFLGSSIGNFHRQDASTFLKGVAEAMSNGDRLLVGIDLRKDASVLEPAYDDAEGVTAQFNLNLLGRINHELGGRFDVGAFDHKAIYDVDAGRIEMYLVSAAQQTVRIESLDLEVDFEAGESIHTEDSYKYSLEEIDALVAGVGLEMNGQWFDSEKRFSLNRMKKDSGPEIRDLGTG